MLDFPRIGRRILIWFSVFFVGFASYAWFSHFYAVYRAWESVRVAGFAFWDVELAFWPVMIGLTVFLVVGALALAWNLMNKAQPATEESFLVWMGLAVATGFGWQLAVAIAYASVGFTTGGYPLLEVLQPAIPTAIGIVMVLTPVYVRLLRKAKPPTVPIGDESSPVR